MRYADARSLIRSGDLIAVRRRSGLMAVGTRLVTGSPYTHNGIAIWRTDGRLEMVQANSGGVNLVPLSQMAGFAFDVYDCPAGLKSEAIVESTWRNIGKRTNYGFGDLWTLFLHIRLGFPLPAEDDDHLICSALAARIYRGAGWVPPAGFPSIPWPGVLVRSVASLPRLVVDPD